MDSKSPHMFWKRGLLMDSDGRQILPKHGRPHDIPRNIQFCENNVVTTLSFPNNNAHLSQSDLHRHHPTADVQDGGIIFKSLDVTSRCSSVGDGGGPDHGDIAIAASRNETFMRDGPFVERTSTWPHLPVDFEGAMGAKHLPNLMSTLCDGRRGQLPNDHPEAIHGPRGFPPLGPQTPEHDAVRAWTIPRSTSLYHGGPTQPIYGKCFKGHSKQRGVNKDLAEERRCSEISDVCLNGKVSMLSSTSTQTHLLLQMEDGDQVLTINTGLRADLLNEDTLSKITIHDGYMVIPVPEGGSPANFLEALTGNNEGNEEGRPTTSPGRLSTERGGRVWVCREHGCGKVFKKAAKMKSHLMMHTGERPFKCRIEGCDWAFTSLYRLKRHEESHEKKKDFMCLVDGCGKLFTTIYNLRTHEKLHLRPCENICSLCGERFPTIRKLDAHFKTHDDAPKLYKCPEEGCDRMFYSPHCMGSHTRVHTAMKDLTCTFEGCGKEFDKPCRLKAHMRKHTGEKPYVCYFQGCGWSFATASKLTRHKQKHSGLRKFMCPECGKAFMRSEHLKGHMVLHSGGKPFVCPVDSCQARFSAKSSVYVHLKKHKHPQSITYFCPLEHCNEYFESKATLREHIDGHYQNCGATSETSISCLPIIVDSDSMSAPQQGASSSLSEGASLLHTGLVISPMRTPDQQAESPVHVMLEDGQVYAVPEGVLLPPQLASTPQQKKPTAAQELQEQLLDAQSGLMLVQTSECGLVTYTRGGASITQDGYVLLDQYGASSTNGKTSQTSLATSQIPRMPVGKSENKYQVVGTVMPGITGASSSSVSSESGTLPPNSRPVGVIPPARNMTGSGSSTTVTTAPSTSPMTHKLIDNGSQSATRGAVNAKMPEPVVMKRVSDTATASELNESDDISVDDTGCDAIDVTSLFPDPTLRAARTDVRGNEILSDRAKQRQWQARVARAANAAAGADVFSTLAQTMSTTTASPSGPRSSTSPFPPGQEGPEFSDLCQGIRLRDPDTGTVYLQTQLLQDDPPSSDNFMDEDRLLDNLAVDSDSSHQHDIQNDVNMMFAGEQTSRDEIMGFSGSTINLQDLE